MVTEVADETCDTAKHIEHLVIEGRGLAVGTTDHHAPTVEHIEVLVVLVRHGLLEIQALCNVTVDKHIKTILLADKGHMYPLLHREIINIYVGIPRTKCIHIDTHGVLVVVHIDTGTKKRVLEAVTLMEDVEEAIICTETCGIHKEEEGVSEFCTGTLIVGQVELLGVGIGGILCKCLGLGTGQSVVHDDSLCLVYTLH